MSQSKSIVIIGYPKSGNTWATRLVAELVGCPVAGFWNSDQEEIAVEGEDRMSNYRCYKSHHQWNEISEISEQPDKMIYIVRDPRDICVSGAHYFNRTTPIPSTSKSIFIRAINKAHWLAFGRKKMIVEMLKALLQGNDWIHRWCNVSWLDHYLPYSLLDDVLVVTYADLIEDGKGAAVEILNFLEIERSNDQIDQALKAHSFEKTKERFEASGEHEKGQFLRKGTQGEWRTVLTKAQKEAFKMALGEHLMRLKFDLD